MDTMDVVQKVCRLPLDFYAGSKSMIDLVSDAGIKEHSTTITVASVGACLREHPSLVDQWLNWSANKRVTSGWYFLKQNGQLKVGFYPAGEILIFEDPILACAEFVTREVKALMDISNA